jgi:hypothetical protein
MSEGLPLRKELKEKFMQELTFSEKLFFLRKAKEAITLKGYLVSEDLFYFCYFLTLKKRIRSINLQGGEGYLRFLLVEGMKDIEEAIKLYEERLEKNKLPTPDPTGYKFIEYFSE